MSKDSSGETDYYTFEAAGCQTGMQEESGLHFYFSSYL